MYRISARVLGLMLGVVLAAVLPAPASGGGVPGMLSAAVPGPVGASARLVTRTAEGDIPPHSADVIFLIDGSGSVSLPAFELQLEAIKTCVCGPGAPLAADGTTAVGAVQFSSFARVEVPLTVLESPADAEDFCAQLDLIDRMAAGTSMLPGLQIVRQMLDNSQDGTSRALVILTDTILFDFNLAQVESLAEDLREDEFPVRICTAMTDGGPFDVARFERICNTAGSPDYDPSEPSGILERLDEVSQFQPICADCVSGCTFAGGPDCDGDGIPDKCEPDCDANGVPDDCDILNDPGLDLNGNGELDACEDDCNGNGIADFIDIGSGFSTDCNTNGIPDECEGAQDCNSNGVPDFCEIGDGVLTDCNLNGVPDDCEDAVFGVVTPRVVALQGEPPDIGIPVPAYRELALGVAVHDSGRVFYGDVGDPGNPTRIGGAFGGGGPDERGDDSAALGRIFRYDLVTGKTRRLLREGELVAGAEEWMSDPPAECGPFEAFLSVFQPDIAGLAPGFSEAGDGAIRGVAADGSVLLAADIIVASARCGPVAETSGLLRLDEAGTSRLFRAELDVCLLEYGVVGGAARVRPNGTYVHPEVQATDTELAWLISQTDDGECVVIRSGEPSPDAGVYAESDYTGGDRPYQSIARHNGDGQSLFYAETTESNAALVLDEDGAESLIAKSGTRSNLPGNPSASIQLRYSHEEGADVGVYRGVGPDVVFRGRAGGESAIFVWEREQNPAGDPSSDVVEPIVREQDIESVAGIDAVPGSVELWHPVLGGPCAGCDPVAGVVLFMAGWFENDGPGGEPGGPRQGLFALTPADGVVPIALPGDPLPPPHEGLVHAPIGTMLEEFDLDMNGNGLAVYTSWVSAPPTPDNPDPEAKTAVLVASVKPGRCDVSPPFGVLDLGDIVRFVTGLSTNDPNADLAEPFGTFDLADVVAFVTCFGGGCP